jgi:hypothetical protein
MPREALVCGRACCINTLAAVSEACLNSHLDQWTHFLSINKNILTQRIYCTIGHIIFFVNFGIEP